MPPDVSRVRSVTWGNRGSIFTIAENSQNVAEASVRVWSEVSGLLEKPIPVTLSDLGDAPDLRVIGANAEGGALVIGALTGAALLKFEHPNERTHLSATWYLGGPADPGARAIAWSPDALHLATSTGNIGTIAIYERADGKLLGEIDTNTGVNVEAIAYSSDGTTIAIGGSFGVRLYDANDFTLLRALDQRHPTVSLAWGPTKNILYSGTPEGAVREIDIERGIVPHTFDGHPRGVTAMALSPDGTMLATSGVDRQVRVWDTKTHELLDTLPRDPYTSTDEDLVGTGNVEWVPGTEVVVASRATVQLYRMRDGASLWLHAIPVSSTESVSLVTSNQGVFNVSDAGHDFVQFRKVDGTWADFAQMAPELLRPNVVKELVDDCDFTH